MSYKSSANGIAGIWDGGFGNSPEVRYSGCGKYRIPKRIPNPQSQIPLFSVELPSRVEVVEIQNRVEHHEITTDRLAAIDGVRGEQDDVPFLDRNVDHGGALC